MTARKKASNRKAKSGQTWLDALVPNVVGPLIRRRRLHLGMTQERLATLCQVRGLNLTRGTLAKIESRGRLVKACELFIIAKVLQMPMESFYPPGFGASRRGWGRRAPSES